MKHLLIFIILCALSLSTSANQVLNLKVIWDSATMRADGSLLPPSEIAGYVVAFGSDPEALEESEIITGNTTEYNDLPFDTYYIRLATVDTDGIQGEWGELYVDEFKAPPSPPSGVRTERVEVNVTVILN